MSARELAPAPEGADLACRLRCIAELDSDEMIEGYRAGVRFAGRRLADAERVALLERARALAPAVRR